MRRFLTIPLLLLSFFAFPVLADFKAGGTAYMQGDYVTAARHFQEAAERGDHRAMYALGSLYAGGHGVERDYKSAYTWFRKAAKYGRPDAYYKIGLMYEQGLGLKQDFSKALRYYGRSAKAGYALAQYKLGAYYDEGLGVEADPVKAYAWLTVAHGKLDAALNTPSESDEASAEFLEAQDDFKQQSADQKLGDLRARYQKLDKDLSAEDKQAAQALVAKYSRY